MILKKLFSLILIGGILLVGCAENGDENSMDQESNREISQNSNEQTSSSSNTNSSREIVGTGEYGRGAKSDGQDTNSQENPMRLLTDDSDSIIIYFSRSGNTENLVKMIQNETQADILELTILEPYPADYDETVDRADEERESGNLPEISAEIPDMSQYNQVYLGYQTWSMTLSNPIMSFLESYGEEIDGKTIHPFSSNAGYGEGNSIERIQELLPNSSVEESFSVEDEDVVSSENALKTWLDK